jgi:hypothetical protein
LGHRGDRAWSPRRWNFGWTSVVGAGILPRMRRWRLVAAVPLGLLVAASVSRTGRYTLDVVDTEGRPQTAYALYNHQGHWLNPAHPVSYDATPRTFVRSDDAGRLAIPAGFHLHYPFPLQTHPSLWIEMIYVPRLHNAYGRIGGGYAVSTPGAWETDAGRRRAVVFDLSDRPELWQGTLANLSFFISPLVSPPGREFDQRMADTLVELIGHFRAEYDAFLARYGDVPRPRPPMPVIFSDEEKRRWAEMVDADLAQRPTWGMEIQRLYARQLARLAEAQAALKR